MLSDISYHSCSGGEKADYIKCEVIGGGSPRHLKPFSNLKLLAALHTYQYTLCMVVIVDMLSKLSEHAIPCCYC